jgi:amino acid adenylation domain-containing protein
VLSVEQTNYPLTLYAQEAGGQSLELRLAYNSDLFAPDVMARMVAQLGQLFTSLASATQVADLYRLPDAELWQLQQWNQTATPYPADKTFIDLFEAQVQQSPNATAIIYEGMTLSYAELDARANQLAHHLLAEGVQRESLIGLCVERSHEMVVALLAIMKTGAAYVPLDPAFPSERIKLVLEDAATPFVVTQSHLLDLLDAGQSVIVLDQIDTTTRPMSAPATTAQPHQLAYTIYTSGSTGKPKGVAIEHHSLVNFLCAMQKRPGLTAQDRCFAVTTIAFDIATLELYLPLIVGGSVVVAARDVPSDGQMLYQQLRETGATMMQATPTTWQLLETVGWDGIPTLKALCGGDTLPVNLAVALQGKVAELWNMYGPTEATVWASTTQVVADRVTLGQPFDNTTYYILDEQLNPVPIGGLGELHIGGVQVARGYVNRPKLTAERFIPNPFGAGKLYKTGDLCRFLPTGDVEFLGRTDFQVKIRGFRIELGEIETRLLEHPDIREAVVIVREDTPNDKRLVAYLVTHHAQTSLGSRTTASADLRTHLAATLPNYMLPSAFVTLDALPLTPNKKIDRRALPAPDRSAVSDSFVAPRTESERVLAELWGSVLGVETVSVNDNFFAVGGHSLLATQVIAHIQELFGVTLPIRDLFENPTIAECARLIEAAELAALNEDDLAGLLDEMDGFSDEELALLMGE